MGLLRLLALAASAAASGATVARTVNPYVNSAVSDSPGFLHSGTPPDVPPAADCAIRELAYQYGQKLAPHKQGFKSLYEALQLHACAVAPPDDASDGAWRAPNASLGPVGSIIFVDTILKIKAGKARVVCACKREVKLRER